jgi:ATP-dependent RNA helicase SUPV3L1/SUV3
MSMNRNFLPTATVRPLDDDAMIRGGRGVTAVLGPTNTGKTHYAIERMIAHRSGIIGLPLRLLAREVYNRLVARVGAHAVSLVTGEEKITPPGSRYAVCTVEAMPRRTTAAFVAIDEVQLAGDLERGHIFTDRLLNLRGMEETLLLGAGTVRGILSHLLPGLNVVERPRMSQLFYAGARKITRLPRRSAIVAFSADEVYAIAELVRRQRGGAAVVLGALSPRTRNAQVELYQNGDVDYLIATDAIGMGLNLDVDHVAFAQDHKFDGYQYRPLNPAELGQIAGRAGRHVRDGTFGVTGRVDPFPDELVERIEAHDFDPVRVLQWRTDTLDFSSLETLRRSLDTTPAASGLTRALPAVDQQALDHLATYPEIRDVTTTPARVEKLWDTCALPDYRRIAPAQHADLIATLYADLVERGTVNEDFMAEQVDRADRTDGEIDTLSARISQIRTWTYVSHRPNWLADPTHWQEKTRKIEDRLSDALHERLTKRFVDRRTSVLMKRLRENAMLEAQISVDGDVYVEGHLVGQLAGFRFTPDNEAAGPDAKTVLGAAQKALGLEYQARAARLHAAGNGDFAIGSDGTVRWLGAPVARLTSGDSVLRPRVVLLADDHLEPNAREHVVARIERFVQHHIATVLKPLDDLAQAEDIEGLARGLAFQIVENLGVLFRRDVTEEVKALDQDARAQLRRHGVRFGAYHIFMPALLKPAPAELITLLWALGNDGLDKPGYGDLITVLAAGRTSVVTDPAFERTFYKLAGFRFLGKRAVRIDILERLADLIRPALNWKPGTGDRPDGAYDGRRFTTTPAMLSILGATPEDIEEILKGLGYRADPVSAEEAARHLAEIDPTVTPLLDAPHEPVSETGGAQVDEAAPAPDVEEETREPNASTDEVAAGPASDAGTATPEVGEPTTTQPALDAGDAAPTDAAGPVAVPAAHAETAPADAAEEPAEEPKPVLLWRPGTGRSDTQRNRGQRSGAPHGRGRGDQQRHGQAPAQGGEGGQEQAEGRQRRSNAGKGSGKPGGKRRDGGPNGGRPDGKYGKGGGKHAKGGFASRPPQKERPVDPDSPFAKLAALKEKLGK